MNIAPGTMAALSGMDDNRAYFLFDGDLDQMGTIYMVLSEAGFPVVKNNVYPGFTRDQEEKYKEALAFLYKNRTKGWWSQRKALIKYGVCSESEFYQALGSA